MPALSLRSLAKPPHGRDGEEMPASHLDRAATVRGVVETEGELHIHGVVLGRINAGRLVVGLGGVVEGDIVAREVHVGGRFEGRIFALNVTVDASADVTGRIFHNTVSVERGARIDARMPWRPPAYFETLDQLPETRP